jgi:hypothetical protein
MMKTTAYLTGVCMFMLCLSLFQLQAKKITTLGELSKPQSMVADGEKLFIVEGTSIYIYSLKNHQLVKKFGKPGEGPQEFRVNPFGGPGMVIFTFPDHILVNSQGKLSYFTKNGGFIKEQKTPPFAVLRPVKNNFIGSGFAYTKENEALLCFNLFNSKLEKIKEIHRSDIPINAASGAAIYIPYEPFLYQIYQEKIFIPDGKDDFAITIFDSKGNKIYRIEKDYKRLKVDETYKKRILLWYQRESPLKMFWEQLKKNIKFKSHFPAILDIALDGERLYVFTYKKKNHLTECIILDLEGNEQKKVFLPFPEVFPLTPYLYSLQNNLFYTLVENEENETWELHMEKIIRR